MLRNLLSRLLLLIGVLCAIPAAAGVAVKGDPRVEVTITEQTATALTLQFKANADCGSYYVVQYYAGTHEAYYNNWAPSLNAMGYNVQDEGDLIMAWGKEQQGTSVQTWKGLAPLTDFEFVIQCLDNDGAKADLQIFAASTASQGGDGTSTIDIKVGEFSGVKVQGEHGLETVYVQRVTYTPNDQTLRYYDLIITQDGYIEMGGADGVRDMMINDYHGHPDVEYRDQQLAQYAVDVADWNAEKATKYHACAVGMNAAGVWGPMTDIEFATQGYVNPDAQTIWWGYGDGQTISAIQGGPSNGSYTAALRMPDEATAAYDGAELEAIRFAVAGNTGCTDVSYFVIVGQSDTEAEDLALLKSYKSHAVPVGDLSKGWHEFKLAKPITIHKGDHVYIGYTAKGAKPIALVDEPGTPGSCYMGGGTSFKDYGVIDGYNYVLAAQAFLKSNHFKASATLSETGNFSGETGRTVGITGNITNLSAVPVKSYTLNLTVDGTFVSEPTYTCDLENGQKANFVIATPTLDRGTHTYTLALVALNGEPVANRIIREGNIEVVDIYLTRRHVFEDVTGTWCPNCPRASSGLEVMTESFPDRVIGIAVHGKDRHEISDYSSLIAKVTGYPTVFIDRQDKCGDGSYPSQKSYFDRYELKPIEGENRIVLAQYTDNTRSKVALIVRNRFAEDHATHSYRLGFVVTEDHVWDNQAQPTGSYAYEFLNHIARKYDSYYGIEGSVPEDIKAGECYYYRYDLTFPTNVTNRDNAHIVALLQKNSGAMIINGDQISTIYPAGTYDLNVDDYSKLDALRPVTTVPGTSAPIYDLTGRRVNTPAPGSLYIQDGRKLIAQ